MVPLLFLLVLAKSATVLGSFEVRVKKRELALISQSGAFDGAALAIENKEEIGFSAFVSYGNAADLTESDFLRYFADDKTTKVIALKGLKMGKDPLKL